MALKIDVPDDSREDFAHMLIQLSTSLIGSTCIYQGEELGLDDADRLRRDQLQDPWGIHRYSKTFKGRDTCRTPMTWNSNQPNGGFSGDADVESWLPVDERHIAKGGFEQQGKQGSLFERNKAHLEWRKDQAALVNNGQIDLLDVDDDVIAFNKDSTHLIIDSSYTQEEIKSRKGWGHLSLCDIEFIAKALPDVQIFMYHHDIFKSDSQIDTDSKQLLSKYSNVRIAQQFEKIQLA